MAYFLKKTKNKKGVYLQIYESYYDPERKSGAHRSYKPIGYVHELQNQGIEDPISFFGEEVRKLNQEHQKRKLAEKDRQISSESPERFLGYFPLKNINDSLGCKKYVDLMQTATGFRFNVFDMLSALIYARAVHPCSKSKTYDEVIPKLFEKLDFSLDQLYSGLEYLGSEYEKIIEIFNHQIRQYYPPDTSCTYFDCTNFYFEIDREDDFRLKGPSKENKKEPIVGLGLLLDANQIPIGMKLYPGNESEKPVLRTVIDDLKQRNHISVRTIQVADKGLNCCANILHALKACQAKRSEYGNSAKYVSFVPADKTGQKTDGTVKAELNEKAIDNARRLAGYNMIVTSELHMPASDIYAAYHNLWRIEESFRIMKSQLDARPVYLQKEETITGHFLICYLAVLLTRILQIHILKGQYSTEEIFDFIRDFRVAKISDRKYINLARSSSFIKDFSVQTGLPLTSYFLGNEDIKKVLGHRF